MPRPGHRVNLSAALSLNINEMVRWACIRPGFRGGPRITRWTNSYSGELLAEAIITSSTENPSEGWLRIQLGSLDQWIILISQPRHFGGRQWYFMCPVTNRRASVLWMPPGANRFCSRQTWRGQVAYSTQFMTPEGRVHRAKS